MKISIVTATYNSEKTVADTIESVLLQKYSDYEHIIIDGQSTDRTLEIVESYREKYKDRLRVYSEKDSGLYDAMNKGINAASGDIIGILNSDDIYACDTVLSDIADKFEEGGCDGIYSDLVFMDAETMKKPVRTWKSGYGSYKRGWHPPHPTLYLKREVYDKLGMFDTSYKIAADYDFMLRLMKNQSITLKYIDKTLIHMRSGGVSTGGLKGYTENLKEADRALRENNVPFPAFVDLIRICKTLIQLIRR